MSPIISFRKAEEVGVEPTLRGFGDLPIILFSYSSERG